MKKWICFIVSLVLLGYFLGCKNKAPAGPDLPENTATVTSTITTTHTNTPNYTATPTFTITSTYTATPPDIILDNFEDGNFVNLLKTWVVDTYTGSSISSWDVVAAPPGNGSYAVEVTGTANAVNGAGLFYSLLALSTGGTASVTPLDLQKYNYLRFAMKFAGAVSGAAAPRFHVYMTDDSGALDYDVGSAFMPVYQQYAIPLSSFVVNGGTLQGILSAIKQVQFQVYIFGAQNSTMNFELVMDDIRFTHN